MRKCMVAVRRNRRAFRALWSAAGAISAGVTFLTSGVHAATSTYPWAGTAGALSLNTDWVGNTAPTSTDIGVFNNLTTAAQTESVGAGGYTIGELQILTPGGNITITDTAADPLTLAGVTNASGTVVGIDMSSAGRSLVLNAPIVLGNSQTWLIGSGQSITADNVAGASISQTNSGTNLTLQGLGSLVLDTVAAANSYTGTTTLNGSQLKINVANATSATNALSTSSSLAFGSGYFLLQSNTGTAAFQTVAATAINVGASEIQAARGTSAGLTWGRCPTPSAARCF